MKRLIALFLLSASAVLAQQSSPPALPPNLYTVPGGIPSAGGSGGASSPTPGVFNSSFDPPLFQNYTLTTSGAQTALNLTANPIDSHSISLRPTLNFSVSDLFSYANGDLHTANANWAYQSGTFTVSSNQVFSSSALSFAYRSDGPTATATEWAQVNAVVNVASATQNGGPCVRMSTSAQTAYCLQYAQNVVVLLLWNAGSSSALATYTSATGVPTIATGNTVEITATGTTISAYVNGVCLTLAGVCGVTDATIANGSTGVFGAGNATSNGYSQFQSGTTIPSCSVQVDSSQDGTNFTPGGIIPTQNCAFPGIVTARGIANYTRVNVTALAGISSLSVIYSGRISATAPVNNASPVSNGQWVNAGEVLYVQDTTQGIGSGVIQASYRIQQQNGQLLSGGWNVTCNFSASGGFGTGIQVPVSGYINGFTSYISTGNFPQGAIYTNLYLLPSLPAGATTSTCQNTITSGNIAGGLLLASGPTGSSYPISFVGTSAINWSPWSVPGYTTILSPAQPSAGAEWSQTITTTGRTCIQGVSFTAAAGSTNITPTLLFKLSVGGNTAVFAYTAATAQTSATTHIYSFSPGANAEVVTGTSPIYHIVPFNNGQMVCYNSGLTVGTIGTLTTGINGTTQYSVIGITVQLQNDNN